jgi:hypothetical protein
MSEWFVTADKPRCKTCGSAYAQWSITDGHRDDGPFCEKHARERAEEYTRRDRPRSFREHPSE